MTYKMITAATFATAMGLGGVALADTGFITGHHDMPDDGNNVHMDDTMMGHFEHVDQDNDGKVTRAEIEAHAERSAQFNEMFEDRVRRGR